MTTWYCDDYKQWIKDGCNINDKVISLNISNSSMIELTETLYNLINLQTLCCSNSKLTKLPKTLGNLINLRELNCSHNILIKLPKTISNLINLQILFCYDNKLTKLPETFGNLINLRMLFCHQNKFIKFPISIIKLKKLRIFFDKSIKLSFILQRFIEKNKYQINNNVHNNSIQASLLNSINNLLLETITKDINLLDDNILDNKSKSILYNFIEDKTQSYLLINFKELLIYILEKIDN